MNQYLTNQLTPWIDPRVLSVQAAQLHAYLLSQGWKPKPGSHARTVQFEGPLADDGDPLVFAVPKDEIGNDYHQAVITLLTNLSLFEDRYAGAILTDVLHQPGSHGPRELAAVNGAGSPTSRT